MSYLNLPLELIFYDMNEGDTYIPHKEECLSPPMRSCSHMAGSLRVD